LDSLEDANNDLMMMNKGSPRRDSDLLDFFLGTTGGAQTGPLSLPKEDIFGELGLLES